MLFWGYVPTRSGGGAGSLLGVGVIGGIAPTNIFPQNQELSYTSPSPPVPLPVGRWVISGNVPPVPPLLLLLLCADIC